MPPPNPHSSNWVKKNARERMKRAERALLKRESEDLMSFSDADDNISQTGSYHSPHRAAPANTTHGYPEDTFIMNTYTQIMTPGPDPASASQLAAVLPAIEAAHPPRARLGFRPGLGFYINNHGLVMASPGILGVLVVLAVFVLCVGGLSIVAWKMEAETIKDLAIAAIAIVVGGVVSIIAIAAMVYRKSKAE